MKKIEKNIVRLTLDGNNLPPLSKDQQAQIEAINAMPDSEIDYSDAPEFSDADWVRAGMVINTKEQITLRIDSDVVEFFRDSGKRYQTRINAVLKAYMQAHKKLTHEA